MKKALAVVTTFILGFIMIGCNQEPNTKILTENFEEQTSYINENNLLLELNEFETFETDSTSQDIITFRELRKTLRETHLVLQEKRAEFKLNKDALSLILTTLEENETEFNQEDKEAIRAIVIDSRRIRTDFQETSGYVYKRLIDLRGSYNRENLLQIIEVFTDVIDNMNIRIDLYDFAIENQITVLTILEEYLEG